MTAAKLGCRSIDAGVAQLSMHSIRATTGSDDTGLCVKLFEGVYRHWEQVDREIVDLDM